MVANAVPSSPPESGFRRLGYRVSRISRPLLEGWHESTAHRKILAAAVQFGKQNAVELVLAPLHSPSTIRLAKPVAEALGVPLIVILWEPPEYVLRCCYDVDAWTIKGMLRSFEQAVRHAKRCGAASWPMKARYQERYGTDCVAMLYGEWISPGNRVPKPADAGRPIVIAFAGFLYALDAWDVLLAALGRTGWRIAGRDVVIRMMGSAIQQRVSAPVRIEFLGHRRNQAEVRQLLSEADLGYLPYWFDEGHREFAELAFPSKLVAYASARLPILFHGPGYASPCEFLRRFPVGLACNSLNEDALLACIEQLVCDRSFLERAAEACDAAFQEELGFEVFRRRFAELIGIAPSCLRQVSEVGS